MGIFNSVTPDFLSDKKPFPSSFCSKSWSYFFFFAAFFFFGAAFFAAFLAAFFLVAMFFEFNSVSKIEFNEVKIKTIFYPSKLFFHILWKKCYATATMFTIVLSFLLFLNSTTPSVKANKVKSLPIPTFFPGW